MAKAERPTASVLAFERKLDPSDGNAVHLGERHFSFMGL
jgi:hypothetical protein